MRKAKMRNIILGILLAFFLSSCAPKKAEENVDYLTLNYEKIEQLARGSEVRFYMWGGSTLVNDWIDSVVAPSLKEDYDITLKRVPMDAGVFVNRLLSDKDSENNDGIMDIVWINGENFRNAKQGNILFGPFVDILPNYNSYVDPSTASSDAGFPVDGYEAPYGRAQFVFEYDSAKIENPPENFAELLQWAKKNPGKFTYAKIPDFTGSAFIRQAFYDLTGGYEQYTGEFNQNLFNSNSEKLYSYLNQLKPYLWRQGETYPSDQAALDSLFERGEVSFNMTFTQTGAASKIAQGRYPSTVKTQVFTKASIANTHFMAIPFNAPNKAGAMVTINQILSPKMQLSKNDPKNWGDFTVLDFNKLNKEDQNAFNNLDLGSATLPLEKLSKNSVPEISAKYIEALETGWEKNVLND